MVAHDVHDLIQFYDVNIHSQKTDPDHTSPDLCTCQCDRKHLCAWKKFFDVVIGDPSSYGTPYLPDVFALQEVGNVPGKYHVPCTHVVDYLNSLPGQGSVSWNYECTDAHGACAVFWRNDSNGFMLEDSFQIPLTDSTTFLIQAVKLGTRTGDRHIGVASVHTDPANPSGGHACNHAYVQMMERWGNIHYLVAGDFNQIEVTPPSGLTPANFGSGYTAPGCTPGKQIDHVFLHKMAVPSGSQLGNLQIIDQTTPAYSDHRGLGVTLYWA